MCPAEGRTKPRNESPRTCTSPGLGSLCAKGPLNLLEPLKLLPRAANPLVHVGCVGMAEALEGFAVPAPRKG